MTSFKLRYMILVVPGSPRGRRRDTSRATYDSIIAPQMEHLGYQLVPEHEATYVKEYEITLPTKGEALATRKSTDGMLSRFRIAYRFEATEA